MEAQLTVHCTVSVLMVLKSAVLNLTGSKADTNCLPIKQAAACRLPVLAHYACGQA